MSKLLHSFSVRLMSLTASLLAIFCGVIYFVSGNQNEPLLVTNPDQLLAFIQSSVDYSNQVKHDPKALEDFARGMSYQGLTASFTAMPVEKETEFLSLPLARLQTKIENLGVKVDIKETRIGFQDMLESQANGGSIVFDTQFQPSESMPPQNMNSLVEIDVLGAGNPEQLDSFPLFESKEIHFMIYYDGNRPLSIKVNHSLGASSQSTLIFILIFGLILIAGLIFWASASMMSVPIRRIVNSDVNSESQHLMAETANLTELRLISNKFNMLISEKLRSEMDATNVLNAVSHDLLAPITSMRIRTEFISEPDLKEKISKSLDDIEGLSKAILEAARGGRVEEPYIDIDLNIIIGEIIGSNANFASYGFRPASQVAHIRGKRSELSRLFQNLLSNAYRYAQNTQITTHVGDANIIITLEDDGPGIPDDMLSKITKPFVRIERSNTAKTAGFGLGLFIVQSIVQRHDGTIEFENKLPRGLKTTLKFPLEIWA